jgi:ubiquitin carboxyl-terminal hydrolase L5
MLNIDAFQEEEFEDAKKRKKAKKQSKKASTDDSAFHFVAYVPIQDQIWRLDGLDSFPQKFGSCGSESWLNVVAPVLSARMAECEDGQLQFSLLALVRDPLIEAREALCKNIDHLAKIDDRLNLLQSDWEQFAGTNEETLLYTPNETYGITTILLEVATSQCDPSKLAKLGKHDDATTLIELRQTVETDQGPLRATVKSEMRSNEMDEEMDLRNDYGPFIQNWMGLLAENLELKDLVTDARR